MATNIGELAVKLSADIAGLKSSLKSAESEVSGFKDKVSSHLGSLNTLMGGLFAGFTLGALQKEFWGVVDGMNALKDAAEGTGASVENLSALRAVTAATGDAFETAVTAVQKVNQALNKADGENAVSQAFKAIGMDVDQLKQLDPAEATRQIAEALNKYADDGDKARLGNVLLGKSYAELAPFMKDLGEQTKLNGKVTAEQAEQADDLNKKMIEIKKIFSGVSKVIVTECIPVVLQIAKAFTDTADQSGALGAKTTGLSLVLKALAATGAGVYFVLENVANSIAGIGATIAIVMSGGSVKQLAAVWKAQFEDIGKSADNLTKKVNTIMAAPEKAPAKEPETRPSVNWKGRDDSDTVKVKTPKAPKEKKVADLLSDDAKMYESTFNDLNKTMAELDSTDQNYTRTQKKMLEVMTDPRWLTMPEAWRTEIATRAELVIAAEKEADAKKKLADAQLTVDIALGKTDTSIEAQRKQMEQLALVYQQGTMSAEEFAQAAGKISGATAKQDADKKLVKDLTGQTAAEDKQKKLDVLGQAKEKGDISQDQFDTAKNKLEGITTTWEDIRQVGVDASGQMASSFTDFVTGANKSFGDFAKEMLANIAKMILQMLVLKAIKAAFGGGAGAAPVASANGNIFSNGSLIPFATGGIVSQPSYFPMANGGTGLVGEAGIEGIFPITRINGKLGISARGAGSTVNNSTVNQITVNVNGGNTNAETSQAVSAAVVRALAKSEIANQQQRGGLLNPMQIKSR